MVVLLVLLTCVPISKTYAKVYLITEHEGVDHSMLAVIDEQGNLTGFMSKQPALEDVDESGGHLFGAYDKARYDKGNGVLTVTKAGGKLLHVNISNPIANAAENISCIQLTTDSETERKIVNNIQLEKISSNPLDTWFTSNCAVTIENILEKSGYLEKSLWNDFSYAIPGYGQFKNFYAPSLLEKAVIKREEEIREKQKDESNQEVGAGQSGDGGDGNGGEGESRIPNENNPADGDSTSRPGSSNGEGDMCYPEENNPAGGDSTSMPGSGNDEGSMCFAPPDDYAAETDATQYPGSSQESWKGDNTGNGNLPGVGDIMNEFADQAALVGPNLPYRRILWLFSGESPWDSFKTSFSSLLSGASGDDRKYFSEIKDSLRTITGIGN